MPAIAGAALGNGALLAGQALTAPRTAQASAPAPAPVLSGGVASQGAHKVYGAIYDKWMSLGGP